MQLPCPPLFTGKKFAIWTMRMQSYFCFIDSYVEFDDKEKESLTLYLIEKELDNSLVYFGNKVW